MMGALEVVSVTVNACGLVVIRILLGLVAFRDNVSTSDVIAARGLMGLVLHA